MVLKNEKIYNYERATHEIPLSFLTLLSGEGKWIRNIDYYRLDGSTNAQSRKKWAEEFNDETNVRYETFSVCIDIFQFRFSKISFLMYF